MLLDSDGLLIDQRYQSDPRYTVNRQAIGGWTLAGRPSRLHRSCRFVRKLWQMEQRSRLVTRCTRPVPGLEGGRIRSPGRVCEAGESSSRSHGSGPKAGGDSPPPSALRALDGSSLITPASRTRLGLPVRRPSRPQRARLSRQIDQLFLQLAWKAGRSVEGGWRVIPAFGRRLALSTASTELLSCFSSALPMIHR